MNISVFSGIELYLTAFGWLLYNVMYQVLVQTGLAILPFLFLLLRTISDYASRYPHGSAATSAIAQLRVNVFMMFFLASLGVTPAVNLSLTQLRYHCAETVITQGQACAGNGAALGATGTALDFTNFQAFGINTTARVPVLWAMVMQVSGGMNYAAIKNIPQVHQIQGITKMLEAGKIRNPLTAVETQRFFNECYLPALSKVKDLSARGLLTGQATATMEQQPQDLSWPGSDTLLNTPGLYQECGNSNTCGSTLSATVGVPGWPPQVRDTDDAYTRPNPPAGRPTCKDWWNGNGGRLGLRDKLANEGRDSIGDAYTAGVGISAKIASALQEVYAIDNQGVPAGGAADMAQNVLARAAFENTPNIALVDTDAASLNTTSSSDGLLSEGWKATKNGVQNVVGQVGLTVLGMTQSVLQALIISGSVIIQSMLLLLLFAVAPVVAVLGQYNAKTFMLMFSGYLGIRFWTVLWAITTWLQQTLVVITERRPSFESASSSAYHYFGMEILDGSSQILDLITLLSNMLYVFAPPLFGLFLTWAGITGLDKLGAAFQQLNDKSAGAAGEKGVATSVAVVKTAASAGAGGAGGAS